MSTLQCPACGNPMERIEEPDMTFEKCSECGGLLLDKGELNTLATGMAGNIEYSSVDSEFHQDRFPLRQCPKCDQEMVKVNLLRLSDLIFDFCTGCETFFLDRKEVEKMNEHLRQLSPNKQAEEYRGYRDDRLVRIDRTDEIGFGGMVAGLTSVANAAGVRIAVFFKKRLKCSLRVHQEHWPAKLAHLLGLSHEEDHPTGDSEFDRLFIVQGEGEPENALSEEALHALIHFVRSDPTIFSRKGTLEINPVSLVYTEGPYHPDQVKNLVEEAEPMVERLLDIAQKIES